MRIVTGNATDAPIAAVSPAVKNSVRLVPQIIRAALVWHQQSFLKTDVASAAEFLRQLISFHFRRTKDLQVTRLGFDCRRMFFTRTMTTFTSNSRHQVIRLQLSGADGGR